MRVRDRIKGAAVAVLGGAALLASSGVMAPQPAFAWWRGGVWVGGPAPGYYAPRPYYYPPPIVVAPPPPVYYAPPPVVYAPPVYVQPPVYAPPPAYFPPQTAAPAAVAAARSCYTPSLTCPMEVARAAGSTCYCSDSSGDRVYGRAQ